MKEFDLSDFTRTIMVDGSATPIQGQRYLTMQAALADTQYNELQTKGGTIIVEAGTYTIDSILSVPSNVTLIGRGNVVLTVPNNVSVFQNASSSGNTRIVISGFKILITYSNYANPYSPHVIYLRNVTNCRVEKVTIDASGANAGVSQACTGILLYANNQSCSGNVVAQCTIRNFGRIYSNPGTGEDDINFGVGIALSAQTGSTTGPANNVVRNNFVSDCYSALQAYSASDSVVSGNIFQKSYYTNILVANNSRNLVFLANQALESTTSAGIYANGSEGIVIQGNVFRGNGIVFRFGIGDTTMRYNTVSGNVCTESSGNGIHLLGLASYNTIFGNACISNDANGIRVQTEDASHTAQYNMLTGNVCVLNTDSGISNNDSTNALYSNIS